MCVGLFGINCYFSHVSLRRVGSKSSDIPPPHPSHSFPSTHRVSQAAVCGPRRSSPASLMQSGPLFTHIMSVPLQCSIERARGHQPHCCCSISTRRARDIDKTRCRVIIPRSTKPFLSGLLGIGKDRLSQCVCWYECLCDLYDRKSHLPFVDR